jgi:hypothetical protein
MSIYENYVCNNSSDLSRLKVVTVIFPLLLLSNISERFSVDTGGFECRTVLRNLSSIKITTMANAQARVQIDLPDLVLELILHAANCCFEQVNSHKSR